MIVVTGGAGFIGSALTTMLNQRGVTDLWIVDIDDHPEKKRNLQALRYDRFLDRDQFIALVETGDLPRPEALFHLGACSSTTEMDVDYLTRNNVDYTRTLARYCLDHGVRLVYASSAATYGSGEHGYGDDEAILATLKPLNPYGQSKQDFDLEAKREGWLNHIAGLKYFNVFGPNEYHKGDMRSMVLKGFEQIRDTGKIRLFKSGKPEYADGGQVRDFLYVKDAVAMTLFFLDHPKVNGIYNIGAGKARSWNDLAAALFNAMGQKENIEYFNMPTSIAGQYQYHTEAAMDKLQRAGWTREPASLEDGVRDYVQEFLMKDHRRLGQ